MLHHIKQISVEIHFIEFDNDNNDNSNIRK